MLEIRKVGVCHTGWKVKRGMHLADLKENASDAVVKTPAQDTCQNYVILYH